MTNAAERYRRTKRYQRTIEKWSRDAIRSMLRSNDPIAVYDEKNLAIQQRIDSKVRPHARPSRIHLVVIAVEALLILAIAAVTATAAGHPLYFIPLAIGLAAILTLSCIELANHMRLRRLAHVIEARSNGIGNRF